MTFVVRVRENVITKIKTPMVIFTNSNRSYSICGMAINIPWLTYRSRPKG